MIDFDLAEGCPSVYHRPRDRNDGTVFSRDHGPDRLLNRLRAVHDEPRFDIAPELENNNARLAG
jgi:hypothetical protein